MPTAKYTALGMPEAAVGDLRHPIGGRPRDPVGDGEHDSGEQGVGAERGDDRVEPEDGDEHAVGDAGGEDDGEGEEHGAEQPVGLALGVW